MKDLLVLKILKLKKKTRNFILVALNTDVYA